MLDFSRFQHVSDFATWSLLGGSSSEPSRVSGPKLYTVFTCTELYRYAETDSSFIPGPSANQTLTFISPPYRSTPVQSRYSTGKLQATATAPEDGSQHHLPAAPPGWFPSSLQARPIPKTVISLRTNTISRMRTLHLLKSSK